MDPRISRWAKTLVNYCLEVQPGQTVLIDAAPVAEPLVAEVYRETLRVGGHPIPHITLPDLERIALENSSDEQLAWIDPVQNLLAREVDCRLSIAAATNTRRMATISEERIALRRRALAEVRQIRSGRSASGEEKWCGTLYPTEAYAQDAEMALADFEEFVFEACFLNSADPADRWRDLGRRQQFYVDWLRDKRQVHVIGTDTDLRLGIAERIFRNSDGKRNFPSGEFFTGPIEDSAEGTIRFTLPSVLDGHLVQDIRLTFERGRVVEATAGQGRAYLEAALALDGGSRLLGEFAFGNNFGITRSIRNILYDEKIGGTIHLALGNSYPETGGKNVSALHWDMICDLRAAAGGGEVYVDDILFLKDGVLLIQPE
jgi:aminopeptidase